MDDFKWGVVGPVEKAEAFAADVSNTLGQHILHAFVPSTRLSAADTITIPHIYHDIHQLLQSDVDAVYIASPYHQHYAQVKQCLLQGKPVLCERPIAGNAEELRHLMQLSKHNHVFMLEAMWIRFLPGIKKMLSIISSGAIGEIISVKASVSYKPGNEAQAILHSGSGTLFELGIYPVFLSTLLLGKPEYVQAKGKLKGDESDFFSAFLSYEGGQYAFIETTGLTQNMSSATITGDKGLLQIKNLWSAKPEGMEVDFFDGTKVWHQSEWKGHGLQFEVSEVYECVENNEIESQLYCHHFSLDVMETMDTIRKQIS
jgi:predicted dehydrogenase